MIGFVALPFIVLLVLWQAEAYLLFTGLLAGILFGIGLFVSAGFDIADRNDQIHYTVIEASQCAGQPAVEVRNDTSEWVITKVYSTFDAFIPGSNIAMGYGVISTERAIKPKTSRVLCMDTFIQTRKPLISFRWIKSEKPSEIYENTQFKRVEQKG